MGNIVSVQDHVCRSLSYRCNGSLFWVAFYTFRIGYVYLRYVTLRGAMNYTQRLVETALRCP